MNLKDMHSFSMKWIEKYMYADSTESDMEEGFSEDCFALGFEMDAGNAFKQQYGEEAFSRWEDLEKVINKINDHELLGSAILSRWRYITHWSQEDLLSADNRHWFIIALSRLKALTEEDKHDKASET